MESKESGHHVLLTSEAISKRIAELGACITERYRNETVTVLALTNGALIFAAGSYENSKNSGKLIFRSKPKLAISGQQILIVDDILDTGLTLHGVKAWLREQNAASIDICVLLDKQVSRRKAEISVNWVGFKVPDVFVYGYGLDRNEFDRNLPFIAQIAD